MSASYQRFVASVKRCDDILSIQLDPTLRVDSLRYIVVMLVSSFDMYVADRFAEAFVPYIKTHKMSGKEECFFMEIGFTARDAIEIIKSNPRRPFRGVRKKIDNYLSRQAMQSEKAINKLFKFYKIPSLVGLIIKGKSRNKKRMEELIARRHQIVHNADYDGRNRLQTIDVKTVKKWMATVKEIVANMENEITRFL